MHEPFELDKEKDLQHEMEQENLKVHGASLPSPYGIIRMSSFSAEGGIVKSSTTRLAAM